MLIPAQILYSSSAHCAIEFGETMCNSGGYQGIVREDIVSAFPPYHTQHQRSCHTDAFTHNYYHNLVEMN